MPHSPLRRTASNSRLSPSIYQPPLAHKKVLEMRYTVASQSFLTFAYSRNIPPARCSVAWAGGGAAVRCPPSVSAGWRGETSRPSGDGSASWRPARYKEVIRFEGQQTWQTKAMIALFGLFAEVERDLIVERTRKGLAAARAKRKQLGRPKGGLGKSKLDGKGQDIQLLLRKHVSKASIA
jgi:hypothetical protein